MENGSIDNVVKLPARPEQAPATCQDRRPQRPLPVEEMLVQGRAHALVLKARQRDSWKEGALIPVDDGPANEAGEFMDACLDAIGNMAQVLREMMAMHQAQLPSETRDLYQGGCGCRHCNMAVAALAGLPVAGITGGSVS